MVRKKRGVPSMAIAASTLLSFFPFLIVMLSFCRNVLHWPGAVNAIYLAMSITLLRRMDQASGPGGSSHSRAGAPARSAGLG